MKQKKTPKQWLDDDWNNDCAYRTLAWRFAWKEADNKITEEEYVNKYVHPDDRWKV